jgi:hypothetical protein
MLLFADALRGVHFVRGQLTVWARVSCRVECADGSLVRLFGR